MGVDQSSVPGVLEEGREDAGDALDGRGVGDVLDDDYGWVVSADVV